MVNKKLLMISYCSIFISIYFISIAYAGMALYLQKDYEITIPIVSNTTTMAISSFSLSTGISIIVLISIVLVIAIILIVLGHRSMGAAV